MRFQVRQYADFGGNQFDEPILIESDDLKEVKDYVKNYFRYETYFNSVYFIDTQMERSGYLGRDLSISYGSLERFCGLPECEDEIGGTKVKEILKRHSDILNTRGTLVVIIDPRTDYDDYQKLLDWLNK